jgi:shikimate kinase
MLDNAWSRANNSKDPFDMGDFALLTMSLGSSMESPLRRSANGEYIQDGIEGVIERGVAAGLPMKDIVRWEHMKSKEAVASEILGSYIKDGKLNPSVWDGYQVQVISVTADDLINDSGFKTKSTLDGRPRLYNKFTLATILKNPSKYPLSDIAPIRSMNPAKKGTNAEVVGQQWYNVVDSVLNTISPDAINLQAIGRTQMSARQFSKKIQPPKGITVLDFDDTLATTKSGVRAKIPNTDGTPKPGRKVVFLAGGAGSGKSNVVKQLGLEGQGFKVVNSDISLEWLKKNSGLPADMRDLTKEQRSTLGKLQHQSRQIAKDKMMKYRGDGNGVIIDGTGGSIKVMEKQVQEFKDKGYDVSMLFVETSLDVALDRNQKRKERSLLDVIVRKNHEAVQNNKKDFRKMFGDRFMDVNTDNLKQKDPMPPELTGKMNNFVSSYENRRLDAEQFATEGADILEQGGTFDFSEFNVVVEGQTAPLFNKALKLQEKFGNKDMFVLTARPAESQQAIFDFLKANGLNIPLKNITGLANSTPEAKALWMADKVGEGYNDFYFADDALQNVQAVQNMLDQFDVKSKVQQAKRQFSKNMNEKFNDIIEDVTGIESEKRFSAVKARKRGASKGKFRFFIPPSHEDFVGLLYNFMGKGEKGNQHRDFFEEALVKPLNRAYRELNAAKQSIANDYKSLNKQFEDVKNKLNKKTPDGDFIYQDAIRTYLWDKHGYTIPGLTPTDQAKLVDIVNSDPDLQSYAEALNIISKQDAYVNPTAEWETGDIRTDLDDATGRVGREQYFEEFFENTNTIFSPENLNKIEAAYGKGVREALEDILYRTKTGRNRPSGQNQLVNKFMNYLNGSVASTMFFNIRSAVLQQMSMVNFINYADNNIFAASKAFANQPQYWKDWATIFNSDFMKQRRGGIKTDVNGAELAASIRKSKNSPRAVIAKLLELGFLPTQIGDNIAIATGGASFYRNRVNKYIKEGLSKKEAESKAFIDFQALAEATQQSARPDMVSQQQASPLGKVILAFQNVTSQFNRLGKKAFQDIYNRRITPGNTTQFQSDVSNASRIAYYLGMQNLIFYGLQTALFSAMFDEDEDDKRFLEKKERMINGSIDSVLRGTGVMGAVVSTLKNMAIKWHEQRDKGYNADESAVLMEMLNVSPPLGIKARKLVNAERTLNYNKDVIKEMETFDIDNPMWSATTNYIESFTNIPVNRLYNKTQNVRESLDNQHSAMERALMFSGWSKWNLGIEDTKIKEVKEVVKEKKKIESKKKADIKKKEKKIEQEKINKAVIEENKKKSKKDGVCAAINKHGKRCSNKVVEGKTFCTIHEEVKQNETGKKSQCKAIKSDGKRCKMQTSSKSGNCYYHD